MRCIDTDDEAGLLLLYSWNSTSTESSFNNNKTPPWTHLQHWRQELWKNVVPELEKASIRILMATTIMDEERRNEDDH